MHFASALLVLALLAVSFHHATPQSSPFGEIGSGQSDPNDKHVAFLGRASALLALAVAAIAFDLVTPQSSPFEGSDSRDDVSADNSTQPLWESSGKFEGDMVLTGRSLPRNGDPDTRHRWPNRVLPYEFAAGHFTTEQQNTIKNALRQFEWTCLRVEPRRGQANYVLITRANTGCHSLIGYVARGAQQLNLQHVPGGGTCLSSGTIVHEFLHAAGFFHQQSATGRDRYINIWWSNIIPEARQNFQEYNTQDFGVGYDYVSVMHYSNTAFAIDQNYATLSSKFDQNQRLGNDVGMTYADIEKVNRMYGCAGGK